MNNAFLQIVLGTVMVWLPMPLITKLAHHFIDHTYSRLWPETLATVVSYLAYRLFVRNIAKQPLRDFSSVGAARELGAGLLLGGGLNALLMATLGLLGVFQFDSISAPSSGFLSVVPLYTGVAMLEEMVGRGIVYGVTQRALGTLWALAISSLVFGLVHMLNPDATLLGGVSCTLFGLLLASAYLLTGRLWICVGFHLAWNFFESQVFSGLVSGYQDAGGLIHGQLIGSTLWTGGRFGVEGSIVALPVAAIASGVLLYLAHRRGAFAAFRAAVEGAR